jgi:hypothetical protein
MIPFFFPSFSTTYTLDDNDDDIVVYGIEDETESELTAKAKTHKKNKKKI